MREGQYSQAADSGVATTANGDKKDER